MYPDPVSLLGPQHTCGRFLHHNRTAGDDVFQSGIVVLPAIDTVEGDGAQTVSPLAIADYLLSGSVRIGYRESETKGRVTSNFLYRPPCSL